jgi:hypothetical protein
MSIARFALLAAACFVQHCHAEEELITTAHYPDGEVIPYILNYQAKEPKYVVILFRQAGLWLQGQFRGQDATAHGRRRIRYRHHQFHG